MGTSLQDYEALLVDWAVTPIRDRGQIIGAVLINGPEVHLGVTRRPHGAHRRLAKTVLTGIIQMHGHAITTVMRDNPAGLAFCRRLGFEITGQTEEIFYLRCERPRHA